MTKPLLWTVVALLASASVAQAALITVTPDSIVRPPPFNSPPFGSLAAGGLVTTQYDGFGLNFGPGPVGIFSDPPNAWGGVNGSGILDLLAPVPGYFTLPSSATLAVTDFLQVEAGNAAPGNLLLSAYDINGFFIASVFSSGVTGPHGRSLMTIADPGIHSFVVSTPAQDTYGVDQIAFDSPTATATPEPGSLTLLGLGLASFGGMAWMKKRKAKVVAA